MQRGRTERAFLGESPLPLTRALCLTWVQRTIGSVNFLLSVDLSKVLKHKAEAAVKKNYHFLLCLLLCCCCCCNLPPLIGLLQEVAHRPCRRHGPIGQKTLLLSAWVWVCNFYFFDGGLGFPTRL